VSKKLDNKVDNITIQNIQNNNDYFLIKDKFSNNPIFHAALSGHYQFILDVSSNKIIKQNIMIYLKEKNKLGFSAFNYIRDKKIANYIYNSNKTSNTNNISQLSNINQLSNIPNQSHPNTLSDNKQIKDTIPIPIVLSFNKGDQVNPLINKIISTFHLYKFEFVLMESIDNSKLFMLIFLQDDILHIQAENRNIKSRMNQRYLLKNYVYDKRLETEPLFFRHYQEITLQMIEETIDVSTFIEENILNNIYYMHK